MRLDGHSILVLDASPFGRSLDLIPSINAIRAAYPASHIAVAASSGICELLTSLRLADKTVNLGAIKPSDKGLGSALLRLFRLSRSLGGQELDLVLDFSPAVSTLLYGLTRRARIITPAVRRERLIDRRRPDSTAAKNSDAKPPAARSSYESVLAQLDLNSDISKWVHVPFPHESSRFEESLARSGSRGGEPILLLYTAEAGWSRSWSTQNYTELAGRLASNYGVRVVAADVPYNSDFNAAMAFLLPREAIKIRSPRAAELIAAIARSSLVVTDDSGVARMAGGLGTPAIDLGPSAGPLSAGISRPSSREIETVYQEACHLLQNSRTGVLFRD